MSDASQGPGWWQASDGKWYPPETTPGGPPATGGPGAGPGGFAPNTPGTPGTSPHGTLAEWPERVVAALIDAVLLVPLVIVYWIMTAISSTLGLLFYIPIAGAGLYFAWLTGETGASPGKRLTGIKIVSESTGQPIGGVNGIVRQIAHVLDSLVCCIGYFLPLFDAKKQTIADKVMTTLSISGQEKQPFGPDLFQK